jgi:hypothetical protein
MCDMTKTPFPMFPDEDEPHLLPFSHISQNPTPRLASHGEHEAFQTHYEL